MLVSLSSGSILKLKHPKLAYYTLIFIINLWYLLLLSTSLKGGLLWQGYGISDLRDCQSNWRELPRDQYLQYQLQLWQNWWQIHHIHWSPASYQCTISTSATAVCRKVGGGGAKDRSWIDCSWQRVLSSNLFPQLHLSEERSWGLIIRWSVIGKYCYRIGCCIGHCFPDCRDPGCGCLLPGHEAEKGECKLPSKRYCQ